MKKTNIFILDGPGFHLFRHRDGSSFISLEKYNIYVAFVRKDQEPFDDLVTKAVAFETWDFEAILQFAKSVNSLNPIDHVFGLSEKNVCLAAAIREALKIGGMTPAIAHAFRNKVEMKRRISQAGLLVPAFTQLSSECDWRALFLSFPRLILKPVDGYASKGIFVVENPAEVERLLASGLVSLETYMLEEFIDSPMMHAEVVVRDGRVAEFVLFESSIPVLDLTKGAKLKAIVSANEPLNERVHEYAARVLGTLGMVAGVAHLEIFLRNDGEIVFCEVAARVGGTLICQTVEAVKGFNLYDAWFRAVLREPEPVIRCSLGKSGGFCIHPKLGGELVNLPLETDLDKEWLTVFKRKASIGDRFEHSVSSTDSIAEFSVVGSSRDEVDERLDALMEKVVVKP